MPSLSQKKVDECLVRPCSIAVFSHADRCGREPRLRSGQASERRANRQGSGDDQEHSGRFDYRYSGIRRRLNGDIEELDENVASSAGRKRSEERNCSAIARIAARGSRVGARPGIVGRAHYRRLVGDRDEAIRGGNEAAARPRRLAEARRGRARHQGGRRGRHRHDFIRRIRRHAKYRRPHRQGNHPATLRRQLD